MAAVSNTGVSPYPTHCDSLLDRVRAEVPGLWLSVLTDLAPALHAAARRVGRHVPCPGHGGKDGFRLFADANWTGGGVCNSCGAFCNGFDLLQWVNGWSFKETLQAVAFSIGLSQRHAGNHWDRPVRPTPPLQDRPDPARLRAKVDETWYGAIRVDHASAHVLRKYLASRGIDFETIPDTLRLHPFLGYYEGLTLAGTYPAMVAVVHGPDGQPVSVHRTYLSREGTKAPVREPKKMMMPPERGATSGGAIRLFQPSRILAVAEGIETALSVRQLTGLPVWATATAGGMERLVVPDSVEEIEIWADHDINGCGQQAADRLAQRLRSNGQQARISLPGVAGSDWNDVLMGEVLND